MAKPAYGITTGAYNVQYIVLYNKWTTKFECPGLARCCLSQLMQKGSPFTGRSTACKKLMQVDYKSKWKGCWQK